MSFFIGQNSVNDFIDAITEPERLVAHDTSGDTARFFDHMKDLRQDDPDGKLYRGSEFKHVASFKGLPLLQAVKLMDEEFMSDKKKFYAWVDRGQNKRYLAYDRRMGAKRSDMVTFQNGKEI